MSDPVSSIRIVIVDDHMVVREGLRLILETEPDFEVAGEAEDGRAAIEQVTKLNPVVVLMDLRMPRMDGLDALEWIVANHPSAAVVVLTTFEEDDLMRRAVLAGARGYLLKDCTRQTLVETVRAAARGDALFAPHVLKKALEPQSPHKPSTSPGCALSQREIEVLEAVARGLRNKEIADDLHITERTVKAHLAGIFQKLGVDSRAGAVSTAMARGVIGPRRP